VEQMLSSPLGVRDYRRGFEEKGGQEQWQKLWHFNVRCESYPTRTFVVRKDRPSADDLCSQVGNRGIWVKVHASSNLNTADCSLHP
jgi:hypothetical protein